MPEAKRALQRAGVAPALKINKFFMAADVSNDFYLSFKEYTMLSRVVQAFALADRSGDGKVSLPEAKRVLGRMFASAKSKLTSLFVAYTTDDFYLDAREFYKLFQKLSSGL